MSLAYNSKSKNPSLFLTNRMKQTQSYLSSHEPKSEQKHMQQLEQQNQQCHSPPEKVASFASAASQTPSSSSPPSQEYYYVSIGRGGSFIGNAAQDLYNAIIHTYYAAFFDFRNAQRKTEITTRIMEVMHTKGIRFVKQQQKDRESTDNCNSSSSSSSSSTNSSSCRSCDDGKSKSVASNNNAKDATKCLETDKKKIRVKIVKSLAYQRRKQRENNQEPTQWPLLGLEPSSSTVSTDPVCRVKNSSSTSDALPYCNSSSAMSPLLCSGSSDSSKRTQGSSSGSSHNNKRARGAQHNQMMFAQQQRLLRRRMKCENELQQRNSHQHSHNTTIDYCFCSNEIVCTCGYGNNNRMQAASFMKQQQQDCNFIEDSPRVAMLNRRRRGENNYSFRNNNMYDNSDMYDNTYFEAIRDVRPSTFRRNRSNRCNDVDVDDEEYDFCGQRQFTNQPPKVGISQFCVTPPTFSSAVRAVPTFTSAVTIQTDDIDDDNDSVVTSVSALFSSSPSLNTTTPTDNSSSPTNALVDEYTKADDENHTPPNDFWERALEN